MKKRSTEILQRLLIGAETEKTVSELLTEYPISEKTLRSDIQEILDFIRDTEMPSALSFDGHSLRLEQPQNAKMLTALTYSMDPYHYKMSLEERKIYIIIVLLYHEGYYSMQQLADEMYVTRNTIIGDCKVVDEYLQKYKITFVAKSKMGIRIEGSEENIRSLLVDIFRSLLPSQQSESAFFLQFIMKETGFPYPLTDVIYHMNSFTREHSIIFAKDIFFEIAVCIFVLLNRMQQAMVHPTEQSTAPLDLIGSMVQYVAQNLGFVTLLRSEIVEVEKAILLRDLRPQIQSINDFELYGTICHFLFEISREVEVDLQADDLLVKSMLSHIKSMSNWGDAEFDMQKQYGDYGVFLHIRTIAEKKFSILETYLQYKLDDRMKDSIVIHICAALLRNWDNLCPCNVIVSCPGSMATSKYIEAQIKNYFGMNVVKAMSAAQVEAAHGDFAEVDFIVSTVPIHDSVLPVIVVSPLLTVEDINQIQSMAFQKNKQFDTETRKKYALLSKIYSIYETGDSQKIAMLNRGLERLLSELFPPETAAVSKLALLHMLKPQYIRVTDQALGWAQAMKDAAEDLLRDGYFGTAYVEEAIAHVAEYGSYIIVNKGIALAHASKESGVYEDGLSLLVSQNGIRFDDGEVVYLMFFFSQKGETDYLNLFKEIIQLGKDQCNIEQMKKLKSNTEIYALISSILNNYTE